MEVVEIKIVIVGESNLINIDMSELDKYHEHSTKNCCDSVRIWSNRGYVKFVLFYCTDMNEAVSTDYAFIIFHSQTKPHVQDWIKKFGKSPCVIIIIDGLEFESWWYKRIDNVMDCYDLVSLTTYNLKDILLDVARHFDRFPELKFVPEPPHLKLTNITANKSPFSLF